MLAGNAALLADKGVAIGKAGEIAERNGGQWRAAVAEAGLDADAYLYRDRSADAFLPWQIIDGASKTPFFRAELEKSGADLTQPRDVVHYLYVPSQDAAEKAAAAFANACALAHRLSQVHGA